MTADASKKFYEFLVFLKENHKNSIDSILQNALTLPFIVPFKFAYDKEKKRIIKKPLIKWKNNSSNENILKKILIKYQNFAYSYSVGIGINLKDYDFFVIDIDNIEIFERNLFSLQNFLEDCKKDAFLIVKTLTKGFHIYLQKDVLSFLNLKNFTGKEPLENFGFECRFGDKLLIIPPSTFKNENSLFSYEVLYVNPENYHKKEIESLLLKELFKTLSSTIKKKEEILNEEEFLKYKNEREKEILKDYEDLKEIVKEVKKRVRFRDFLHSNFSKNYGNYETYHCPFHPPDKNPSFSVRIFNDCEIAKDFHDDECYDIIKFYQKFYNTDFITALKELCSMSGISFPKSYKKTEKKEKTDKKKESFDLHKFNKIFETKKAIYTEYFSFTAQGKKRFRYAMLKDRKQIWEVEEKERFFVSEIQLFEDKKNAFEILILEKFENTSEGNIYNYLAFFPGKQITDCIIESGKEYFDPIFLQHETKYDIVLTTAQKRTITLENVSLEEFYAVLKNRALIISNQKSRDCINKIFSTLKNLGKISEETQTSYTGIFLRENKIIFSKIQPQLITKEELKEAILFLNDLFYKKYSHIPAKFATILKWFIMAPFSFLAKQKKITPKGLYLYGASGTGKSTICLLFLEIWGSFIKEKNERTGGSIDTMARLGSTLSSSCFPVIISEPQGALLKEDIREALKNAFTNTISRAKFFQGQYISIPALANIVFTSNQFLPSDDALLRRFIVLEFSTSERPIFKEDFASSRINAEKLLPRIGNYILYNFEKIKPFLINEETGEILFTEENFLETGEKILKFLYEEAGVEMPEEFTLLEKNFTLEDYEEEKKYELLSEIKSLFITEAKQFREGNFATFQEKILFMLRNQIFPFIIYKKVFEKEYIYITTSILGLLRTKVPNLKILAEYLGFTFHSKKSFKTGENKTISVSCIEVPLQLLIELLFPSSEYTQEDAIIELFGDIIDENDLNNLTRDSSRH